MPKEEKLYQQHAIWAIIAAMDRAIRLIASDMGGVLALHSDHDLEYRLLQDFGLDGYKNFADVDPQLTDLLAQHSKNLIDEEELWRSFAAVTGVVIPPCDHSLWAKYFSPELDRAVFALYQELKGRGIRLICATNTEEAHYAHHRREGHYDIFDGVYASCVMGWAKPEAEFFEEILEKEGVEPSQVLFIDDMEENCEMADSLGMHAFLFKDVAELRWILANMELI
ncbi:MAG: HAD family phosphatase [Sphaerochaeta sp.]|nr:HAD family phosphatase [Sphaerochaeta sp.]